MKKIVLASNNAGKVREINAMLSDSGIEVVSQAEFNAPDVEETGLTFIENAILKARSAAKYSGLPALADDSGLEVDALNGAPGIYSARYSGEGATDQKNLEKLLQEMRNVADDQRSARFHCVLVLMRHAGDPTPPVFHGVWEGRITHEPRGENGFGYDPVFYVPTHDCTAAQLPAEEKNRLSHRGQALRQFIQSLI